MSRTIIAFPLIASISIILLYPSTIAITLAIEMDKVYADEEVPPATKSHCESGDLQTCVVEVVPGGINVLLQPWPYPVVKGTQTSLKISFYQKRTSTVEPHIDYDVTISKAGKQLFDAVTQAGYVDWLHSSEGITTIPYTFQEPGVYSVNVTLFGILFIPVSPDSTVFQVNVT
ncbi:MAG TPA: hypothetical protein VEH06_04800 [Candidatus Bathyarchaeia archaeon]|nr:hypothetical protein [Candidatus Bathyarchaeia archaeon]